jgi:hypothetical protein
MRRQIVSRNLELSGFCYEYEYYREQQNKKKPREFECKNCAFFDEDNVGDGLCRRHAPGDFLPHPAGLHESGEVLFWTLGQQWPRVYSNDWCGEHSGLQGGIER